MSELHFLRPEWLLLAIPALAVIALLIRRDRARHNWHGVIAPHLLPHLLVRGEERRRRLRPLGLLAVVLGIGTLALAGPSWRRDPAAFADDTASLVIAIEVTPTMLARDVQPTRLERAAQKVRDLLALRPGTRAALIAYAGSAHVAMPLTRDPSVVGDFAAELAPDVMPLDGNDAAAAIALANRELARFNAPGAIVLMTGGVDQTQLDALRAQRDAGGARVHLLALAADADADAPTGGPAAPALDRDALQRAADAAGGTLTVVTPDDADVRRLASRTERDLVFVGAEGEEQRWRDEGYWLTLALLAPALLWFRRGWSINHG